MQKIIADPRREYLKQSVMSASPTELVVMLFDACIKNVKLAQLHYDERKDIEATNLCLLKAQAIVGELLNCLDMSFELSNQLLRLYEYLLYELREMNFKKDFSKAPDVLELLESMKETWQSVAKGQRSALGGASYG